jgi:hypothetical protein
MGKVDNIIDSLIVDAKGDKKEIKSIISDIKGSMADYTSIPLQERTREDDNEIQFYSALIFGLNKHVLSGRTSDNPIEGYECDTYRHYVDIPVEPEELKEPLHNYPRLKDRYAGGVFNRRSVFLHIKWGKIKGAPVLRVSINRIGARDEEDMTLVQFDMPVHAVDGHMLKPKEYVFKALNEAKKQFSEKVGCVVCGMPDIWFTKIKTPQYPLYRVMWKEVDFADPENRVCRECYKRVNPTVSDFDPHPEADLKTTAEEVIAAYNLNRYTGKEWYLPDKGEGLVSAVNETIEVHGHTRLDSVDYMAALDRQESIVQLGG